MNKNFWHYLYLMTAVRACGSTLRDTATPRQQSLSDSGHKNLKKGQRGIFYD